MHRCIYIQYYMYVYVCMYIYIYIERERDVHTYNHRLPHEGGHRSKPPCPCPHLCVPTASLRARVQSKVLRYFHGWHDYCYVVLTSPYRAI